MSAKVHLHMHVSDLGKSRDFYERFLGEGPVKVKTGYVKFLPEWAPVNLAVSEGGHAAVGTVMGICGGGGGEAEAGVLVPTPAA